MPGHLIRHYATVSKRRLLPRRRAASSLTGSRSHLLGKKSWNVYNADNIARVRRDEAAAKASEEAEEQRMQEVDAERRLAILRGDEPPPLPPADEGRAIESSRDSKDSLPSAPGRDRKKRKRTGEDDTEFELRLAKERTSQTDGSRDLILSKTSDAPIVGRDGHIDLFGEADAVRKSSKNEEAEAEKRKKRKEMEDQYTMRFSNAAGQDGVENPWYSKSASGDSGLPEAESVGRNAFGNVDPGRKKRDADRITTNDPLAMMKRGAAKVREVKQERRKFQEERDRELQQLRKEEKRRERDDKDRSHSRSRHRERHRGHDEDRHDRRREVVCADGDSRRRQSFSRHGMERHSHGSDDARRRSSVSRHGDDRDRHRSRA